MEAGWAVLELMGHRRLAGWVSEEEIAGAAFIRLDVPEHPWVDGCTCGSARPDSANHEDHTYFCAMFRAPDVDAQLVDVVATQFYAAGALYCLTPTTEQVARGMAQSLRPQPVHRWELPQATKSVGATVPVTHPDDECDCGHLFSEHAHLIEEGQDGDDDVYKGSAECQISDCDCESFSPAIPF